MENIPKKIIVHHDGVSRAGPSFAIINEAHRLRGFPISSLDYYCGYHTFIERDGKIIDARLESDEGAHTTGQNLNSLGIGLAGNFDVEYPTAEQILSLGGVLSAWAPKYNIGATDIVPHRRFAAKSCYGSRLRDNWAALVYLNYEVKRILALISVLRLQK